MTSTQRDQALRDLDRRVTEVARRAIPEHVLVRLVYALGGAAVVHLDANLERDRDDITGDVVVYTDRHVLVAGMNGLFPDPADEPDAGEVSVSVLPRSALLRIDLATDPRVPGPKVWTASRRLVYWPELGRLVLTYAGLDRPVVLGRGEEAEDLDGLYPSLLEDQARHPVAVTAPPTPPMPTASRTRRSTPPSASRASPATGSPRQH